MYLIIFFGIVISITLLIILLSDWSTHIYMVKNNSQSYGWGSYRKFVEQFNKYNWDNENYNGYSLWDNLNGGYIHASVIRFNDKGMIIRNPIEWILVNCYIRKYFKENKIKENKNIIKW